MLRKFFKIFTKIAVKIMGFMVFLLILNFHRGPNWGKGEAAEGFSWTIYNEWPFSPKEAKRRQAETGSLLGLPVEKKINLGNGIQMEFILIPAGKFEMGTPHPKAPNEIFFFEETEKGRYILFFGVIFFSIICISCFYKTKKNFFPQISLKKFIFLFFALCVIMIGYGLLWETTLKKKEAEKIFSLALKRFMNSRNCERPARVVTIRRPFYIGKYEVAQEEWQAIMKNNPSFFKGNLKPVDSVSWLDARAFCEKMKKLTNNGIRLPTESEWEYACRAGSVAMFYNGDEEKNLSYIAWYAQNAEGRTHARGEKIPNAFGLFDMLGNVEEWVEDHFHKTFLGAPLNESPWIEKTGSDTFVLRGGSWHLLQSFFSCRCSDREAGGQDPHFSHRGFRVVYSCNAAD